MMTFNCAAAVFYSSLWLESFTFVFLYEVGWMCAKKKKKKEKMKEKPRTLRSPNLEVMQH